jgi:hypothetical protein
MQITDQHGRHIHDLEGEAWAVCNAGYAYTTRDIYLGLGQQLYRQAMQARIQALFERSDAQNDKLDALLRERTLAAGPRSRGRRARA